MPTFSDILVPVDFSETSREALRFGCTLARPGGTTIHLMHDIEIPTETITGATIVREEMDAEHERSADRMDQLEQLPREHDIAVHREILRSTDPKRSILTYANENDVDLIVLGTHGRSKAVEKIIGSTAERVLRRSPAPSVTVGAGQARDRVDVILVPVDFSEYSAPAVDHAMEIAREHGARLVLLHADADASTSEVERRLQELYADRGGDDGTFVASADDVSDAVAAAAKEHAADLVVMFTHARKGIKRALTSNVADSVVRSAPCPVLTYRTALED